MKLPDDPVSSSAQAKAAESRLEPVTARPGDDLSVLGPELFVPFQVRKLARPSLLWVNRRWFADMGLDLSDAEISSEVTGWLLRDYAFACPLREDPEDAFLKDRAIFHADRYGLTGGGSHGGSGRCGFLGRFHSKGIGQTPLVSSEAGILHSNGMMLAWEAMLEAIASEIARAELPFGAVPVVAIIDMGFETQWCGSGPPVRRALLVRTNFIRPSHFERSIFFGDAGSVGAAQYRDVQRVRDAVNAASSLPLADGSTARLLHTMCMRAAAQLGAARAHRFWLGVFASSNRTIGGALADFGAFRSVASWRAACTLPPEQFGGELPQLLATVESLHFYFRKYLPADQTLPDLEILKRETAEAVPREFRRACAAALRLPQAGPAGMAALEAIDAYYARQQRETVRAGDHAAWRRPWLLDALAPAWRRDGMAGEHEQETAGAIVDALAASGDAETLPARLNAAQRWLMPRYATFQELMVKRLPVFARSLSGAPALNRARVERFIDRQISSARRIWDTLSPEIEVRAQRIDGPSTLLFGRHHGLGEDGAWIEGLAEGDGLRAFGLNILPAPGADPTPLGSGRVGLWLGGPFSAPPRHGPPGDMLASLSLGACSYPFPRRRSDYQQSSDRIYQGFAGKDD